MEDNMSIENQPVSEVPKRPQFITVLCVLTFIGSGLSFVGALWGYFSIKASEKFLNNLTTSQDHAHGMISGMQETMMKAVENAVPNMVIGLLCSLICLYGAIQMWKLKKTGFFIYSVGEITPAISAFFLGGGGLIGGAGAVVGLLLAIVWIVLYAINFKHLK
ncbi:MAG: hypothetical protein C0448_07745 [Sphingobacteriaceae bacterium]|nr:hypothetical protein [Sphingobacteriaceae bacterium]